MSNFTLLPGLVLETNIADGATASVWKAHHVRAPISAAVKQIQKHPSMDRTLILREIDHHRQMNHPFIAKLFGFIEDETHFYLIQEFAEHGTLLSFINTRRCLPEQLARKYFTQLVSAVDYMHKDRRIAHRDIKLENILLDRHNNIKVADFGLSRAFMPEGAMFHTICGSPAYVAPEVIQSQGYFPSADIWSCGIVLFALVAGYLPFYDPTPQKNLWNILTADFQLPLFITPQLSDLLRQLLCKDPERRITIAGICNHPWFSYHEYQIVSTLVLTLSTDKSDIDPDVIQRIEANGIDCREMVQSLLTGETTDMTLLYQLYVQDIQTDKIHEAVCGDGTGFILTHHSADAVLFADAGQPKPGQPNLLRLSRNQAQPIRLFRKYDRRPFVPVIPRPMAGSAGKAAVRIRRLANQSDPQ
jgi:serine/threonine protein kinase